MDFHIMGRELNRHNRIYKVQQLCEVITKSTKNYKFVFKKIEPAQKYFIYLKTSG